MPEETAFRDSETLHANQLGLELARMLDLSSFEIFSRRDVLRSAAVAGLLPFGLGNNDRKIPDCPLEPVYNKRFKTLVAIIEAQIDTLWCGHQGDNACEVAREILVYASHLPKRLQHGIAVALLWLDVYSVKHVGHRLHNLCSRDVRKLLNQGEHRRCKSDPPRMEWCEDHLLHTAVAGIAMLGRLVIHSREPARKLIGLGWSDECGNPDNLVTVAAPPLADLSTHYDVVIVGSGAGGATVANRLTARGLQVLILDVGDFVSPDALIQRTPQADGSFRLSPPRSDEVLYKLYKDAAGQIAGGLGNVKSKLELIIPSKRKKIPPKQTVNVAQAEVFGGGPYVNNAIHLPIPESAYQKWGERQPANTPYEQFSNLMGSICNELGVNTLVTETQTSDRSQRFAEGCEALGEECQPLPVAIRKECRGCGSDNSVDSFGDHIGGIHPYSPVGANSFLTQAMHNPAPANVSYRTRAHKLRIRRDESGELKVDGVDVTRVEEGGCRINATITANHYVVAAGVGATTRLASQSLATAGLRNRELGKRLTANIGTALYAMYDKPIWPSGSGRPEPGVTQCFLVDRRYIEEDGKMVEEPALENWFHFPGTVALALTGWFQEFACVMRKFNHLSMSGIVIPTEVRCSNYVDSCGSFHLEFDQAEFELLLRGMRRVARIYFAAAKPDDGVSLYLPTKSLLMRNGNPARIRNMDDFEWALCEIRKRGPAFVNLLTTHPQGGACLGDVVDTTTFRLKTDCGESIQNMTIADASLFPQGCEINPQLTVKALCTLASEQVLKSALPENKAA
ncbi:GMC oxidoreductase [Rubripirellula amarantea]|uniref:GMC oxidoreductase n=1 Tax=Rubripirellula amarantea TaxID=2527999 RepID=A0A5C5WPY2_9BACT|nr:GMC family oxidoreductase N-terminal domain-containing protein [Rubripirellula amarantea]TWT52490.1 GMC oxidoreductase [Rubripirellula amarantea]